MNDLVVAVIQTQSTDDINVNQQSILDALESIPTSSKVDLVCLPENVLYMRIVNGELIKGIEVSSPVFLPFLKWAKDRNSVLHFGSVPIQRGSKLGNTSVLIYPDGRILPSYTKIHLFDIQLEAQAAIRESDVFDFGSAVETFNIGEWKIGQAICYDVRFSELFQKYAKQEVDVILLPAAFLVPTGAAHWEVLLRARAIESQCYLVAAAQAGEHKSVRSKETRLTFGNSMVVGPWGDVLARASFDSPQILISHLQKRQINKVRRQIPMKNHRRL